MRRCGGLSTVAANFASPAEVTAGQQYALGVSLSSNACDEEDSDTQKVRVQKPTAAKEA